MAMEPVGLSVDAARKTLGGPDDPLGKSTIYRLINAGKLRKVKVGSRTLIATDSIKALMSEAA